MNQEINKEIECTLNQDQMNNDTVNQDSLIFSICFISLIALLNIFLIFNS